MEVIPRTLAENALGGAEGNEIVSRLWAKHEAEGGETVGVDIEVRLILIDFYKTLTNPTRYRRRKPMAPSTPQNTPSTTH